LLGTAHLQYLRHLFAALTGMSTPEKTPLLGGMGKTKSLYKQGNVCFDGEMEGEFYLCQMYFTLIRSTVGPFLRTDSYYGLFRLPNLEVGITAGVIGQH
jgi:hypothetical protein